MSAKRSQFFLGSALSTCRECECLLSPANEKYTFMLRIYTRLKKLREVRVHPRARFSSKGKMAGRARMATHEKKEEKYGIETEELCDLSTARKICEMQASASPFVCDAFSRPFIFAELTKARRRRRHSRCSSTRSKLIFFVT